MRVCIFVADLAGVASRKSALLREVAAVTGGQSADDVCFVGFRQTQPVGDETPAYLPYVPPDDNFSTRVGNTILRLAGAGLMPQRAVESALSRCAPAFIEAILACDPDVVLLDVPWGAASACPPGTGVSRTCVRDGRSPRRSCTQRPGTGDSSSSAEGQHRPADCTTAPNTFVNRSRAVWINRIATSS